MIYHIKCLTELSILNCQLSIVRTNVVNDLAGLTYVCFFPLKETAGNGWQSSVSLVRQLFTAVILPENLFRSILKERSRSVVFKTATTNSLPEGERAANVCSFPDSMKV